MVSNTAQSYLPKLENSEESLTANVSRQNLNFQNLAYSEGHPLQVFFLLKIYGKGDFCLNKTIQKTHLP